MSATEYRPGDIAVIEGQPVVCVREDGRLWAKLTGGLDLISDLTMIGPVLGNVADIAANEQGDKE